jgi:hypothetical protein
MAAVPRRSAHCSAGPGPALFHNGYAQHDLGGEPDLIPDLDVLPLRDNPVRPLVRSLRAPNSRLALRERSQRPGSPTASGQIRWYTETCPRLPESNGCLSQSL